MSDHPTSGSGGAALAETVGYAVAAVVASTLVVAILHKGGVPSYILVWAIFAVVMAILLFATNTVWPTRFSAYAVADRRASAPVIAIGQLLAIAPAGLIVAYIADSRGESELVVLTLFGLLGALWISTLLIGIPMNRSGAFTLPEFLEARFQSSLARAMAAVLIAAPIFLLISGQLRAFGIGLEVLLGISANVGLILCLCVMVLIAWLPGIRGILLSGAVTSALLIIVFSLVYWFSGTSQLSDAASAAGLTDVIRTMSATAMPLHTPGSGPISTMFERMAYVLTVAMALSVTPIFTLFHPLASSGPKTVRTALAASLLLIASSLIVFSVVAVGDIPLESVVDVEKSDILVAVIEVAVLSTVPATGAVLLFGFSGLISFDGFRRIGARQASENGRLIASRITVLVSAIAAGWVASNWGEVASELVSLLLVVVMASVFPTAIAGARWTGCGAIASQLSMLVGAAVVIGLWTVNQGLVDLRSLVADRSPVIEYLSELSVPSMGLIGVLFASMTILLASFIPRARNAQIEEFTESIQEDRRIRPLNSTTL